MPVGITFYSGDEIDEIVDNFGEFWHGQDYDPFSKNCNDFTQQMIRHICEQENFYVPSYVNRFTKMGSIFRMWFKPLQEIVGDIVNYEESEEEQDLQYPPSMLFLRNNKEQDSEDAQSRSAIQHTNIPLNNNDSSNRQS